MYKSYNSITSMISSIQYNACFHQFVLTFFQPWERESVSMCLTLHYYLNYFPKCLFAASSTNLSNWSIENCEACVAEVVANFLGLEILFIKCFLRAATCSSSNLTFIDNSRFFSSSFVKSSNEHCVFCFLFNRHLWDATLLRSLIRLYLLSLVVNFELEAPPFE